MICRFCGLQTKLIKAHVIPEAFFRRLRVGAQPPLLVQQRGRVKRSPIGVYDPNILCVKCDAIFAPWDNYAYTLLAPTLTDAEEITDGVKIGAWNVPIYKYEFLKLFFISLLWRASVSQHPFYRRINLGILELRAKRLIATNNPGPSEEFGIILARFTDDSGKAILDPHPDRLGGVRYSRFYLGRYVAYIKSDTRSPSNEWRIVTMKPGQPLCIVARDMKRSKELEVMREIVTSSKGRTSISLLGT